MFTRIGLGFCVLAAGLLGGCSSGPEGPEVYPVSATVTLNGKPMAGVSVTLIPEDPSQPQAIGSTAEDGTVTFSTGSQLGAVAGKHKVTIQRSAAPDAYRRPGRGAPKSDIPAAWSDPGKTPQSVTVTESGPNELKIDFK